MKKSILYLSSETGGGHRASAKAIWAAVERLAGKGRFRQEIVDVFAECSGFLNIFARLYAPVIKYSPRMWGLMYYWFDDWRKLEQLEKIAGPLIVPELVKLILRKRPTAMVSVHPMVNHLVVEARRRVGRRLPIITVVTDPISVHRAWVSPEVDTLIVATEEARKRCLDHGMPSHKIKVIGLPIHPRFLAKGENKKKIRTEMGLQAERFTALVMGGGEGAGSMYDHVKALAAANLPIQLIVIAGRNKTLENRLRNFAARAALPLKVYGFTEEVPTIMSAADIIVTKAGPGAVAEALAKDLPMIITSWLPGQEVANVEYIVREGAGTVAKTPPEVIKAVGEMLKGRKLASMRDKTARIKKPEAVFEIAKIILNYCK